MGYLFSLLVVLLPFLGQIALPIGPPLLSQHISLGVLLLIPFIVVYLCDKWPVKGLSALRPVRLGGTALFAIILLAVSLFGGGLGGAFPSLLWAILLPLLILSARGNFRVSFGMSAYVLFSVLFSAYLVVQTLYLWHYGVLLPDGFRSGSYIFAGTELARFADTGVPTSLFLSPDGFSLYVLPALVFLLLWDRGGYRIFSFVSGLLITVAIGLTSSSIGIVLALLVWAVYLLLPIAYFIMHPVDASYRFLRSGAPRITLTAIAFVIGTTLISLYLIDGTAKELILPSFREVLSLSAVSEGFSAALKVLTEGDHLLLGVGFGELDAVLAALGSAPRLTLASELFLSVGLIGFGAFALLLFGLLLRCRGKFGYVLALLLILLCLITRPPMLPTFVFWFFLAHSVGKIEMPFRHYMRVDY